MNKNLLFFYFLILSKLSFGQEIQVINSETKQSIESVAAIMYYDNSVIQVMRTDYDGKLMLFENQTWDSIIFYRLGFKKMTIYEKMTTNILFMKPIPNLIEEVIITGQIIPGNKYQSPFKLRYYTAEEIKNKRSTTLADFLQTENNFQITQDPLLGTKVSINGMSGADLKVLIDGVPLSGRINGNLDFSQILLNNVERIEVVDGPLSTIYGTNATGGVINLISKTGTNNHSDANLNIYGESVGVINVNSTYNVNINGHKVNFGLGRNVFLGWDPNADSLRQSVKPIWRDVSWNPKEQYFANLSYYRALTRKIKFNVKANTFFESILNKLNPTSSQQVNVNDEYYNTKKISLSASLSTIFHKDLELQNTINYNLFDRTNKYYSQNLLNGSQTFLRSFDETVHNIFIRSMMRQDLVAKKMKILYGIDFNYDKGISPRIDSSRNTIYDLGIFGMFNFVFSEKLYFQPGFRYSFNNLVQIPLAPTLNFRYELTPIISSRFSYSRGYRLPDIKELFFTFIDNNHNILGNPDLTTETNDNFQVGIDIKPGKSSNRLNSYSTSFTASYFIKQDAIDIVPTSLTNNNFQYMNVGKINGMIFNIDNRLKYKDYLFNFGVTIGGTKKQYVNVENQINKYNFNGTINMNFTYEIKKWDTKVTLLNKFNFKNNFTAYNIVSNEVVQSSYPSYMYQDFNISKGFFENNMNLTIGVKNIWDVKNLRITGYSGNVHNFSNSNEINQLWGRTIFTTINLNLDKL